MIYCERCNTVLEADAPGIDANVASCTRCDPPPLRREWDWTTWPWPWAARRARTAAADAIPAGGEADG